LWWSLPVPLPWLGALVATSGVLGVACSVLVYATTHRASWRTSTVARQFALTTVVCGLATVLWASAVTATPMPVAQERGVLITLAALVLAGLVASRSPVRRKAVLFVGGVVLPFLLSLNGAGPIALSVVVAVVVSVELLDRSSFFTA